MLPGESVQLRELFPSQHPIVWVQAENLGCECKGGGWASLRVHEWMGDSPLPLQSWVTVPGLPLAGAPTSSALHQAWLSLYLAPIYSFLFLWFHPGPLLPQTWMVPTAPQLFPLFVGPSSYRAHWASALHFCLLSTSVPC